VGYTVSFVVDLLGPEIWEYGIVIVVEDNVG
jgi:hypothetical protein